MLLAADIEHKVTFSCSIIKLYPEMTYFRFPPLEVYMKYRGIWFSVKYNETQLGFKF
jgi:hypothetical protein